MKIFYLVFFIQLFFFVPFTYAQFGCDFIYLFSQQDVDDFPRKYDYCNKFYSIEVDDRNGSIYNLDSLSGLTELGVLEIRDIPDLSSISGIYNLRKVGMLDVVQKKYFPSFPQLDTIDYLRHIFGYYPSDLSLYKNIKHISEGIQVGLNGNLVGLPDFTCSKPFRLGSINNKIPNDISNLIPKNRFDFEQISLNSNEKLSLHGLDSIRTINTLFCINNKKCDFTSLHSLKNVNHIEIINQNMYDVQFGVLSNITSLNILELADLENLRNIEQLLPNLREVTGHVYLNNNNHLSDIDLLNDFEIPISTPLFFPSVYKDRINITNNPNLNDCANDYICRALQVYPDSVTLTGNGFNCEKEELLLQCINSTGSEYDTFNVFLFPNPVVDAIYLNSEFIIQHLDIFDFNGTNVLSSQENPSFLDISGLPSGIYFCKLLVGDFIVVQKIVKVGG